MAEIEFDDVVKRYPDGFEAVKHMSLEIRDAEFMILVGPSGCGKSTALRMIAGLEDISSGDLKIGGEVVNDLAPKDRDIAMVFQNYALYPHMTVRDNMGFALKLRKAPQEEIKRRVDEAAKTLELEQHLERKPANLSGGQRQRVAMGRAIVRDPAAFLMDETLSNLLHHPTYAGAYRFGHRPVNTCSSTISISFSSCSTRSSASRPVCSAPPTLRMSWTPDG